MIMASLWIRRVAGKGAAVQGKAPGGATRRKPTKKTAFQTSPRFYPPQPQQFKSSTDTTSELLIVGMSLMFPFRVTISLVFPVVGLAFICFPTCFCHTLIREFILNTVLPIPSPLCDTRLLFFPLCTSTLPVKTYQPPRRFTQKIFFTSAWLQFSGLYWSAGYTQADK